MLQLGLNIFYENLQTYILSSAFLALIELKRPKSRRHNLRLQNFKTFCLSFITLRKNSGKWASSEVPDEVVHDIVFIF